MMSKNKSQNIREPVVAGRFYPENRGELLKEVGSYFRGLAPNANANLQALISPHAGYVFSGEVAASAFNQIPENAEYKNVFVIASSHQMHFKGASVYCGNYRTPLGKIDVNTDICQQLIKSNIFNDNTEPHLYEHSLEVQLPFLQYKLGKNFKLVPIIIGTDSKTECRLIAEQLQPFFNVENLFVISTDFSHYPSYNDAISIDERTAEFIVENNPDKLIKVLKENKNLDVPNLVTSLCGWTSVLVLLNLTQTGSWEYKKISYQNSGDSIYAPDKNRVVGYHAIAVFQNK